MSNCLLKKIKYYRIRLDEKLAQWSERRAHKHLKDTEKAIARFKDMGCFGCSDTGPWECGSFHKDFPCQHETCSVNRFNKAFINASYSLMGAKLTLRQINRAANAVREDMELKKVR